MCALRAALRGYVLFITISSTQETANSQAADGLSRVDVDSAPASAVTWLEDNPGATATRVGGEGTPRYPGRTSGSGYCQTALEPEPGHVA